MALWESELQTSALCIKFFTDLLFYHHYLNGFPRQILQGLHHFRLIKIHFCSSCLLPLRPERYPCFKTMKNFKPSISTLSSLGVACRIANKLSEVRLDIRDHPSTVETASTN